MEPDIGQIILNIIVLIVLVLINAFFAMSEIAILQSNQNRTKKLADEDVYKRQVQRKPVLWRKLVWRIPPKKDWKMFRRKGLSFRAIDVYKRQFWNRPCLCCPSKRKRPLQMDSAWHPGSGRRPFAGKETTNQRGIPKRGRGRFNRCERI